MGREVPCDAVQDAIYRRFGLGGRGRALGAGVAFCLFQEVGASEEVVAKLHAPDVGEGVAKSRTAPMRSKEGSIKARRVPQAGFQ